MHIEDSCGHGVYWDDPNYCRACIEEPKQVVTNMTKKYIPTIAIDFDGVIHSYTSGWQGGHVIPDSPVPGSIEFLAYLCEDGRGVDVVIFSSRAKTWRGRRAIRAWLQKHGGAHWHDDGMGVPGIESIKITAVKPAAVVYIDDRAHRFEGTFPELTRQSIAELIDRKPWNK